MAILSGPSSKDPLYHVLAGLSDLHHLIAKAKKSLEQGIVSWLFDFHAIKKFPHSY